VENELPVSLVIGFAVLLGVAVHEGMRRHAASEVHLVDAVAGPAPVAEEGCGARRNVDTNSSERGQRFEGLRTVIRANVDSVAAWS